MTAPHGVPEPSPVTHGGTSGIATERFDFRRLAPADAPLMAAILADPDVVRNLIGDWSDPDTRLVMARQWIEKADEFGVWAVIDRSGRFAAPGSAIGFCAAEHALPVVGRGPEVYYAFEKSTWGRGVATEAVGAFIDHLLNDRGEAAVEALVLAGLNPASQRLLSRLGMRHVGRYPIADYAGDERIPTIEYELWRVRHSSPGTLAGDLYHAAVKVGQFLDRETESEGAMLDRLLSAAAASAGFAPGNAASLEKLLVEGFHAGLGETGWLHFRVERQT